MVAAGVQIDRVELTPDGRTVIVVKQTDGNGAAIERNEWDEEFSGGKDQIEIR